MQAFYSGYANTGKMKPLKKNRDEFSQGYFERSEGRRDDDSGYKPVKKKGKKSAGDILFLILTIIFLFLIFPVGLVMLWTRKVKLGVGSKLMLSIISAVVFLVLLAFAANIETNNPKVKNVQDKINNAYDWVYDKTGKGIETVFDAAKEKGGEFASRAEDIWEGIAPGVARKTKELLGDTAEKVSYFKNELPGMLLEKYKDKVDYVAPEQPDLPEKQADAGATVTMTPTAEPTPEPTGEPEVTPEPTAAPTQTPEPTKEPVVLPNIKSVSLAPVYYTKGGTYYHLTSNCSGMLGADSHTLEEAKAAGKKVCANCGVVDFAVMNDTTSRYLWIDGANVAHCTDECAEFTGSYKIVLFDEVYNGHYSYCPVCGGDTVFEYLRQNDGSYNVSIEDADAETQLLYKAEQGITVYYGINSRYYHANRECQQMVDDKYTHNLFEALHKDNMRPCPTCDPFNEGDVQEQLMKK